MQRLIAIVAIVAMAGCETFTNRFGPESTSTRAVYSAGGGMISVLSGTVASCTLIESKDQPVKITKLVFAEHTCEITAEAESKEESTD